MQYGYVTSAIPSPPEHVPVRTAARLTGISRELIAQAIAAGELPAFRPGRRWVYVRLNDVYAWLRGRAVMPAAYAAAERVDRSFQRARRRLLKSRRR